MKHHPNDLMVAAAANQALLDEMFPAIAAGEEGFEHRRKERASLSRSLAAGTLRDAKRLRRSIRRGARPKGAKRPLAQDKAHKRLVARQQGMTRGCIAGGAKDTTINANKMAEGKGHKLPGSLQRR